MISYLGSQSSEPEGELSHRRQSPVRAEYNLTIFAERLSYIVRWSPLVCGPLRSVESAPAPGPRPQRPVIRQCASSFPRFKFSSFDARSPSSGLEACGASAESACPPLSPYRLQRVKKSVSPSLSKCGTVAAMRVPVCDAIGYR